MIDQTKHSGQNSTQSLRSFWLEQVRLLEHVFSIRRVVVHVDAGPLSGPGLHSQVGAPRLLICTNRFACYRLSSSPGPQEVRLGEGEVLLLGADSSVANVSNQAYGSMGLIFYPDSLRVYGIRYAPGSRAETPDPLRLQHHNYVHPAPLSEDGRRLLACALNAAGFPEESAYRRQLASTLLIQVSESLRQDPRPGESKAARTFGNLVQHVQAHLGEPITREALGRALRLHPNHVSRLFSRFTKGSFREFLRNSRLDRAEQQLREGRCSVKEVAYACGFGSSSSLIRAFRRRHGVSPGRWLAVEGT